MGVSLTREQLRATGIVKRLEGIECPSFLKRDFNGRLSLPLFYRLIPCEKLGGALNSVVIAPAQIEVHQVVKGYAFNGVILFASREGNSTVYASLINPKDKTSTLRGYRNVFELEWQAWYDPDQTEDIYNKLRENPQDAVLELKKGRKAYHPLFSNT